jgi:hypothetical protein
MEGSGLSHEIEPCTRTADAAAYVLGALENPDGFGAHAESCNACRAELAELSPAAELLRVAVPERRAPGGMNDRIMARVSAEAELLQAAGPDADRPRRRQPSRRRHFALAGACALAATVALAAVLAASRGASHGVTTPATVAPAIAGASATLTQSGSHSELVVAHMPQAPLGKVYEVWLKQSSGAVRPTSALFAVTSAGRGTVAVPSLHHVAAVLVTAEPLGGSSRPTSPPLLVVRLRGGSA